MPLPKLTKLELQIMEALWSHGACSIREIQQELVEIADRPVTGEAAALSSSTIEQFLSGLRTVWQEGEVRPTSKPKEKARRGRRRALQQARL